MKGSKLKKVLAGVLVSAMAISNVAMINAEAVSNNNEVSAASTTQNQQRKLIGYFPSWAYENPVQGNFDVADLQWEELTHIQYSFGFVDEATNKLIFDEKYAINEDFKDYKLEHNGVEVKLDPTLPYKGHFNVLQVMKKKYPNVKVVMSIGGWAASRGFYKMLDSEAGMNTFTDSCVEFLKKYNFDGIDIDFEYPSSQKGCGNPNDFDLSEDRRTTINASYNKMMKMMREKLDKASAAQGRTGDNKYTLSAAVAASAWILGGVSDNSYAKSLDFLSVMSYDFHGGWNQYVENLANIYADPNDTETFLLTNPSKPDKVVPWLGMDWAYNYYRGVLPSEKILMGVPYYTRGWENVTGGVNGLHGTAGSKDNPTAATGKYNIWGDKDKFDKVIPAGANPIWHTMNLMDQDSNLKEYWDNVGKVPYLWNDKEKVFLSHESEKSIDERVNFIEKNNLGGALIWVMNGDYGPNPNYKPGSTNVNEGKYGPGNTLTKRLKAGFNRIGDYEISNDDINAPTGDIEVTYISKPDHPNNQYDFTVKNTGKENIKGGWKFTVDIPKSTNEISSEHGTVDVKDIGDFYRTTVTVRPDLAIPAGGSQIINIKMKLCIGGLRNITVNGMLASNIPDSKGNYKPSIIGAENKIVTVGDSFDPKAGVTAKDTEDGDLTSKIVITGGVNTNVPGDYKVTYSVTDKAGATSTKTITVEVRAKLPAGLTWWESGKTYAYGAKVAYKTGIYECITWWMNPDGDCSPNNTTYWKKVGDLEVPPPVVLEDVNGDKVVDIADLSAVAAAYNAKTGTALYKANLDVNSDGIIDLYDIVRIGKFL
ncbi:MAG: glycosyl hydrolase family 18 protein [Clostridium sp.]